MGKLKFSWFILAVFLLTLFVLTTCDSPLGMGLPIDWEAPVVALDPGPNPRYVRLGTIISGTVTDNVGVERIIMRDATSGQEYFQGRISGDRFEFTLNFSFANNGDKFSVEIAAFDKIGNVGIENLTIIVDLRPPLVESAWIERSPAKLAYLESFNEIKNELERDDPLGEKSEHMQRYQNGWFTFTAKLSEDETRIEDVILHIYDYRHLDDPILVPTKQEGTTLYAPKWLIKEEELINSGKAKWGQDYETGYYTRKDRYYYFVSIVALDKSNNEGTLEERVEDQNFFCMWEKADEPKGIKDGITGNVVYKKMPIQVQLFDDDALDYAWVGLVTKEQWNGEKDIYGEGSKRIQGTTDAEKLEFLYNLLVVQNKPVYNWKQDSRFSGDHLGDSDKFVEQFIKGTSVDDLIASINTGTKDNDYGEFVLFSIVQDKKLSPHPTTPPPGSKDTLKGRRVGRKYEVNIIDDNVPLIVFDTVDTSKTPGHFDPLGPLYSTGNSPEENTFPTLQSDGKTFEINGYTLREKGGELGKNQVERFRMAWIPQTILAANNGANEKTIIKQVENALRWYKDTDAPDGIAFPEGVQYWIMDDKTYSGDTQDGTGILTGTVETLGDGVAKTYYTKQVFRKKFSVLYDNDDLKGPGKGDYKNFTYKYKEGGLDKEKQENETKVFVFCAIDNMQKVVFRTIRLLPNKTPPSLTVYDITGKDISGLGVPPDIYTYNTAGDMTQAYVDARTTYNADSYDALKNISIDSQKNLLLGDSDLTTSLQSYPRKSIIKYWVSTRKSGELAIQSIKMEDKTTSTTYNLGVANISDNGLSYIEYFPEVTSRTFLFTVTDSLGNVAQLQRTIAITNASTLTSITTEKLSGTYGINEKIVLKANFDSKFNVVGSISDIYLNVRYPKTDKLLAYPAGVENDYVFKQVPCSKANDLSLEFEFTVSEGDVGKLETMYNDEKMYFSKTDMNKPITIKNTTKIVDGIRTDSNAFTPGNITGFTWNNSTYSLQDPANGKDIRFDGIRPKLKGFAVSGKEGETVSGVTSYYFKGGETLIFTITADKDIRTSGGTPILQYQRSTTNNTAFKYQSPVGADGMRFALEINRTNLTTDGQIINFAYLPTGGKIVDDVGNEVDKTTFDNYISTALTNIRIYNDQTPPAAPSTTMSVAPVSPASPGLLGSSPTTIWYYSTAPYLTVNEVPAASEPYGQTREYSMDGGLTWKFFADEYAPWTSWTGGRLYLKNSINNQPWSLQGRVVDKAGNVGDVTAQLIYVSQAFPKILSVGVDEPKGTYTSNTGQNSLTFVLNFDNYVKVSTQASVTITLTNRSNSNSNNTNGTNPSYQIQLQANSEQITDRQSVRFTWTGIGGTNNVKEMLNGLYISNINMNGLSDRFGNLGGVGAATSPSPGNASNISITTTSTDPTEDYNVANLPAGYIVDAIPPRVLTYTPGANAIISDETFRRVIVLEFNEDIMKGSGVITIKPASDSLIPPVFRNDGYYIATDGTEYSAPAANRTYVDGFYNVYNNANLNATDKNTLTKSTNATSPSWGTLELNPRTGQTVGPYQRLTHGLKVGNGYTGDYNAGTGANGPNPAANESTGDNNRFLVPDTATKWVLDYKLRINESGNATITAIKNVLIKAKFRWQEVDVANVKISDKTATITLNEPLLIGLHWELSYPAGIFTDKAGNPAVAVTSHEFWTSGAQTPVIRVNRRSYDARAVGTGTTPNSLAGAAGGYGTPPAATTNWNETNGAGITVTDVNGWGFADFNTIHYRIETETPGATLQSGIYGNNAAARRTNKSGVTAAFSGNVYDANTSNQVANSAWNNTTQTNGTWILNNLIRRANSSYTVLENGNTVTRAYAGTYQGFRSYNKDATIGNLSNLGLTNFTSTINQGIVSFDALEAGKSYVVAVATRSGQTSVRGYEGVFRTVIALYNNGGNYANSDTGKAVLVEGSNIKNGMPSVSGFPVQDAAESGDNRYVKMFFKYNNTTNNSQLVWVSTEIVCEWYFIKYGGNRNQSTHMSDGEVNNYLTVGYGDLSYGYNLRSSNDN